MIAVDSSALIAIIMRETEAEAFARALLKSDPMVGAPTVVEAQIVLSRRRVIDAATILKRTLDAFRIETIAFDADMADRSRDAFLTYGKGRHPAKLNFGDCMTYAVAKRLEVPLLYKGDDFARTDLRSAL